MWEKYVDSTEALLSTECTSEISFCRTSRRSENPRWEPYYIGKNWRTRIRLQQTTWRKATHRDTEGWKRYKLWSQKRQTISLEKPPGWRVALAARVAARIRNRKSIFAQGKRKQGIKVDFKYKCTSIQMNKSGVASRNFVARSTRVFPLGFMFRCIL